MPTIQIRHYLSPAGELILGAFEGRLCLCDWAADGKRRLRIDRRIQTLLGARYEAADSPILAQAAAELDEYFAGKRTAFSVPLLFAGTDFQKAVWHNLLEIPYGKTISYSGMAARLGLPNAVRAVAGANAANAVSIFAPCHRVVGCDGSLTGYAGGLDAKKTLLDLERAGRKGR